MRWLLVSTGPGRNPGDDWARLGCEDLIRAVDPDAVVLPIDKHNRTDWACLPRYDRAVVCGMPLFWSVRDCDGREHHCWDEQWWEPMLKLRPLLAFGVGSFQPWSAGKWDDEHVTHDAAQPQRLVDEIQRVKDASRGVWLRDGLFADAVCGQFVETVACPSVWAILRTLPPDVRRASRLCNLMAGGGHYPHFNRPASHLWGAMEGQISQEMRGAAYLAIAHDQPEANFARSWGWTTDMIRLANRNTYHDCAIYIGNRVHGAIAALAAGARACWIGYDSRALAVQRVGGATLAPHQLDGTLAQLERAARASTLNWRAERERQGQVVRDFAQS